MYFKAGHKSGYRKIQRLEKILKLPSWTGGVDPDRATRVSGDGVVDNFSDSNTPAPAYGR